MKESTQEWDMVIQPKARLLELNLKEVWRYRDLMLLFVKRDFIAQYKQTILGPLWHLIQPILTTVIFLLIFGKIAHIPTDSIPAPLFYLSGITIWNYFASCLNSTSNTFVANAGIFGKVYFPRLIIPLSSVLSNLVKFSIQFLLLVALMIFFSFHNEPLHVGATWLWIPVVLFLAAAFGLGLGIITSALTTKYRDLGVLIGFGLQLLMYATPVVYPLSFLKSQSLASWIQWNPLTPLLELWRYALFGKGDFSTNTVLYSTAWVFVILSIGLVVFKKTEKSFIDSV